MRLLEIIDKTERTTEELQFFVNLFKIQWRKFTDKQLNEILDGLRWVSKSRMGTKSFCPRQLFYGYIAKIKAITIVDIFTFGKDGHYVMENFYDALNVNEVLKNSQDATKYFTDTFLQLFKKYFPSKLELYRFRYNYELMFENIAKYENERLQNIRRVVGLNKETFERYFKPIYTELYLANKTYRIRGIIDAIFLMPDNTLMIVDYKSGKPKDLTDKWKFLAVISEMSFYKLLLEEPGTFIYEVEKPDNQTDEDGEEDVKWVRPLEEFKPLKVSYVQMLHFKDLYGSLPIHVDKMIDFRTNQPIHLTTISSIADYWNDLESGNLPFAHFKTKDTCIRYCGYFLKICINENKDFEKIKEMDDYVQGKNNVDDLLDEFFNDEELYLGGI